MTSVLGFTGGLDGYPALLGANHNAAAALVIDGKVVAACEEERFSRVKYDGRFPFRAAQWCLSHAGIDRIEDVALVCSSYTFDALFQWEMFTENATVFAPYERPVLRGFIGAMRGFNRLAGYGSARNRRLFEEHMHCAPGRVRYEPVLHHHCHLASTFFDAPFERALCVSFDGQGESNSGLVARGEGTSFEVLWQPYVPNSLGYLYTFTTLFLGFGAHDEYRVMGLAPYGDRERFRSFFQSLVRVEKDGSFAVDQRVLLKLMTSRLGAEGKFFPKEFRSVLGSPRSADAPIEQRHMDIAAGLQAVLEDTVLRSLEIFQKRTGEKYLCLAGGVALNSTMNGAILRSGLFDDVWIHPAAHDAGTAVGAALYGYHCLLGHERTRRTPIETGLGPEFTEKEMERACVRAGQSFERKSVEALYPWVAERIAQGKIVGWFQGRTEWGPRALGYRSILADARRTEMKDVVNRAVKHRESFRPFAPSCLQERAEAWFELRGRTSPHMLFVFPVREEKRSIVPAITHVDGSARVQTVSVSDNPVFHALLSAFEAHTGVPMVLNTSFNVQGEPMVNAPVDALRCYLSTEIDVLVLGSLVLEKRRT